MRTATALALACALAGSAAYRPPKATVLVGDSIEIANRLDMRKVEMAKVQAQHQVEREKMKAQKAAARDAEKQRKTLQKLQKTDLDPAAVRSLPVPTPKEALSDAAEVAPEYDSKHSAVWNKKNNAQQPSPSSSPVAAGGSLHASPTPESIGKPIVRVSDKSPLPSARSNDTTSKLPNTFVPWSGEAKLACEMQWTRAVAALPALPDDPMPDKEMRGDSFMAGLPPRVLFVHIGKSCGATVQRALLTNAELMKLAGREPFDRVHVHPVRRGVLEAATEVVVVLRDPVERLVSAYNTAACKEDDNITDVKVCLRSPARRKFQRFGFKRLSLLECYPNVTAFADGLDDNTECGKLARGTLRNNETHPESSRGEHVGMSSCFYLGGLSKILSHKRIHLVETKTCDADIAKLPAWLGLHSSFAVMGEAHVGPFPHHTDKPSDEGLQRLRRHLAHEYAFHDELKRLAKHSFEADALI